MPVPCESVRCCRTDTALVIANHRWPMPQLSISPAEVSTGLRGLGAGFSLDVSGIKAYESGFEYLQLAPCSEPTFRVNLETRNGNQHA